MQDQQRRVDRRDPVHAAPPVLHQPQREDREVGHHPLRQLVDGGKRGLQHHRADRAVGRQRHRRPGPEALAVGHHRSGRHRAAQETRQRVVDGKRVHDQPRLARRAGGARPAAQAHADHRPAPVEHPPEAPRTVAQRARVAVEIDDHRRVRRPAARPDDHLRPVGRADDVLGQRDDVQPGGIVPGRAVLVDDVALEGPHDGEAHGPAHRRDDRDPAQDAEDTRHGSPTRWGR